MLPAKQLKALRRYVLGLHEVGLPYDLAVIFAARWLAHRQIAVTVETLEAAFKVFLQEKERDGISR